MKRARPYILLMLATIALKAEVPAMEQRALAEKLMQEIEPGFVPKDERATELFLRQRQVIEKDQILKKTTEEGKAKRELLLRKFREDLASFVQKRTDPLNAKIEGSTDEIIKYYTKALENNPDHVEAAEALYQLGLYCFERDEKDYFEKLALYSEARDQGREDVAYPEEDFHSTIEAYEKLIEKYPEFPQMDSVYYLLSLGLWYEGAFYNAVDNFKLLIEKYPNSRYVEEVWFRLGEYYYDMSDYDDAVNAYEQVVKNTASPLYDKALYKMAWAHFQKDRYKLAIENFLKVLELTYESDEGAASSMRAEVTRYIVKSYAEQLWAEEGRVRPKKAKADEKDKKKLSDAEREYAESEGIRLANRIINSFSTSNKPYVRDIYLETASQLLDESKADGAIKIFLATMALNENSEDNPRFQSQIVDILQEADRLEEARVQNQLLIDTYGKKSLWYQAQVKAQNLVALRYAREAVRDAMLSLAVYYHKQGKELKASNEALADENFKKAAIIYLTYTKEYPERDDTHKALFYFAEAAFELNRYRAALDAYELLKAYPLPMPDNIRRDATFNIVFTFRHVLESEAKEQRFKEIDFDSLTAKSRGQTPEEIPEIGLKYLQAIDDFLKIAPTDQQVPVLLFHAAAIYYVYGQSDEAQTRFFYIIDQYPQTAAANVSARLILDDAVSKEDWQRVVELSKRFKEQFKDQEKDFGRLQGNARFKLARAVFESATELKKNNQLADAKAKYKESADLFSAILADDPTNPYADIMLFNSARAIVESGTMTQALPIYKKLYTEYPQSEYAKTARFQEALALEKMLKFSEAAKAYDAIIKIDSTSESAGDAMLNVALLYEAADDLPKASKSYLEFAKKYPNRPEAPDALLSSAAIYKRMGNTSQQIAMLEQFIKQYKNDPAKTTNVIEAHVQIADTYGDLEKVSKDPKQKDQYRKLATGHYKSAVGLFSQDLASPLASFYAAKAQLILEKPEQDSFKAMKINARLGKDQGDQMTAMLKKLTELTAQNEAIIKGYAQPVWNAESLRRIGALYEHLAKAMINAPCPRDVEAIDEFACDEYVVLLEDKAAILEEKSVTAYKQAYEIAISAYDAPPTLVDSILAGLNRMRPGEYQQVGNLIEKPAPSEVESLGRMLYSGKMASSLHPDEADPDKTPKPKVEKAVEPEPEPATTPVEEKPVTKEPEKAPVAPKKEEEFEEDFE